LQLQSLNSHTQCVKKIEETLRVRLFVTSSRHPTKICTTTTTSGKAKKKNKILPPHERGNAMAKTTKQKMTRKTQHKEN
jgi:hypothetical protein